MPGIFGADARRVGEAREIRARMEAIWGPVQWKEGPAGSVMGAHAHHGSGIAAESDDTVTGWDGEWRIGAHPPRPGASPRGGNVARILPDGGIHLEADPAGLFPLYYAACEDGMVFSSLLRPLARSLDAPPDPLGISQYLRYAHTFGGRTVFEGIHRVRPGQVVGWNRAVGLRIAETSPLWRGEIDGYGSPDEVAEAAAPLVREAIRASLADEGTNVLMMSAGWDSRTLLAAASESLDASGTSAFSHGDLASREIRLARRLCERLGVPWRGRPIGSDVWDLDHLERTFRRTECLVFPHWAWAGRVNDGAACLFSGVLGEVLGGHYGPTHRARGVGKAAALVKGLWLGGEDRAIEGETARERAGASLRPASLGRVWYLREGVEDGPGELLARFGEDVEREIDRLVGRGVHAEARIVEAFVTEHRGVQYIGAQMLSTRDEMDVAAPFADPRLLTFASRVPAGLKVHNRVNRALTRRLAPELAHVPTAAILVPASCPLLIQEASRVARWGWERTRWNAYLRSRGALSRPRFGWVDFEFLREGSALADVVDSLGTDLWDRRALEQVVRDVKDFRYQRRLHPLFDQLGKILTVDRWLAPE